MPEPTSKRIDLETGLSYHYLEWDSAGSEHTVILVHGFLDFCSGWRAAVTPEMQERYHILAPDMRGHGDSDRVGKGGYYHFLDYVADLRSFVGKLGRKKLSIVGHSMGGSIAAYYAGSFPEGLHGLVLMEGLGPPENDTPAPDRVQHWVRGWNRARSRPPHAYSSVEDAAEKLLARDSKLSAREAADLAEWGTRPCEGGVVFKHDTLHLSQSPTRYSVETALEFWRGIQCPVLLVDGADSPMRHGAEEHARRTDGLANWREEEIPGAGHMIQRHQPEALAKLLLGFLG
ncbi:MAG: alpha/beta hydrolase [Myxococcales bacterium]|nr:alpha/beta hydrolase [Myxococcales bacterium]